MKSVWFSQRTEHDAITVGTGVVPIYPRHPLLIAGLAQTAQAATAGRFVLGLGTGARNWLEPAYGIEYPPPIKHLREYLTILRQVFDGGGVDFEGDTVTARASGFAASVSVAGSSGVPLIIAAMGKQALRVIAMAPVVVTEDPDAVRATIDRQYAFFRDIPSYRAIFDAQGVDSAGDLVIAGDEETVAAEVRRYFDAGATEVVATQSGTQSSEERLRTWRLLGDVQATSGLVHSVRIVHTRAHSEHSWRSSCPLPRLVRGWSRSPGRRSCSTDSTWSSWARCCPPCCVTTSGG
ncbi:LLM class flavin-dependent oxidoreductase [Amycolatopsis sp. lyj-112]|uniref:LLM class flavin-dependent oxidoreductase n=1 Tax=Amycolatopsis sp. lyj-112 TaxID=2789288 RepID=UPI00397BDA77